MDARPCRRGGSYDRRSDGMTIAQADIKALPVADNSIDMIFTDPPYITDCIPLYDWLAREAMRILKPGGFVLVMCGGLNLPKVYSYFESSGLTNTNPPGFNIRM